VSLVKVVISLGGSVFMGETGLDAEYLKDFAAAARELSKRHKVYIVAGGGRIAREYITAGRALGLSEAALDILGIEATRLNARLLSIALGMERAHIPERVEEAGESEESIVVMGGTTPGHTTDAVSAMLAGHVGAELLVIATDVQGVYERDPKEDPLAKRFERLTSEELLLLVGSQGHRPGGSGVVDALAAELIHEKGIKTVVVDGRDVRNIVGAVEGRVKGTVIERKV